MEPKFKQPKTVGFFGLVLILVAFGRYPLLSDAIPPLPFYVAIPCMIMGGLYIVVGWVTQLHETIQRIVSDRIANARARRGLGPPGKRHRSNSAKAQPELGERDTKSADPPPIKANAKKNALKKPVSEN